MATNPYVWADQVGQRGQSDKQNAQNYEQNALMALFSEEAARQRPFATMPADLARANFDRQNALPFEIAREQRALENDMALRRYYAENPIPRATDETTATGPLPTGQYVSPDGRTGTTFTVGGKQMVRYDDGTVEYL